MVDNDDINRQPTNPLLNYTALPFESGFDFFAINVTLPTTHASGVLVVNVTIGACLDCHGVSGGPARIDRCGVCGGNNMSCAGCDGVPYSNLTNDFCGVCNGNNATCLVIEPINTTNIHCTAQILFFLLHEPAATPVIWSIIEGPLFGSAVINEINGYILYQNPGIVGIDWFILQAVSQINTSVVATHNVTFNVEDCADCNGDQMGFALLDLCGVCGGNSQECADCRGVPNGVVTFDICGVCGGNGTICLDCFGVPNGTATFDICLVCGGDGSECSATTDLTTSIIMGILILVVFLLILCLVAYYSFFWEQIPPLVTKAPRILGANGVREVFDEPAVVAMRPTSQPLAVRHATPGIDFANR